MKNIKMIFSDVDNTLVTVTNPFSATLKKAIKVAKANDVEFIMCSGRPTKNLVNVANTFNKEGLELNYVVGFNGAQVFDLNKNEIIMSSYLDEKQVFEVTNVLEGLNIDYLTYDGDVIMASNLDNEFAIHEKKLTELQMEQLVVKKQSPKILGLVNPEDMSGLITKVKSALPQYTVVSSTPFFIEITPQGVNKGSALVNVATMYELDVNTEVMCCGDAGNDIEMFRVCPTSVAVSNATDEIKELAMHIVDTAQNDGVSNFIIDKLA